MNTNQRNPIKRAFSGLVGLPPEPEAIPAPAGPNEVAKRGRPRLYATEEERKAAEATAKREKRAKKRRRLQPEGVLCVDLREELQREKAICMLIENELNNLEEAPKEVIDTLETEYDDHQETQEQLIDLIEEKESHSFDEEDFLQKFKDELNGGRLVFTPIGITVNKNVAENMRAWRVKYAHLLSDEVEAETSGNRSGRGGLSQDDYQTIRQTVDTDDPFIDNPNIIRSRMGNRVCPEWVAHKGALRDFLIAKFPRMNEDSEIGQRQRNVAGTWAFIINYCFRLGLTAEEAAKEQTRRIMDAAMVRRIIQEIRTFTSKSWKRQDL